MSAGNEDDQRPGSSAAIRKRKLGRGLGALMGETRREEPVAAPARSSNATPTSSEADAAPGESREGLRSHTFR
jgi:ParB family chromosome partitioning protein